MMVMVMTMTMINDNGDDGWEWHLASVNLRLSAWNLQQMGNRHQSHHKHHDDVNDYYDYEDDLDGGGGQLWWQDEVEDGN